MQVIVLHSFNFFHGTVKSGSTRSSTNQDTLRLQQLFLTSEIEAFDQLVDMLNAVFPVSRNTLVLLMRLNRIHGACWREGTPMDC